MRIEGRINVGLLGGERVVRGQSLRLGEQVEEGGFSDVRETKNSDGQAVLEASQLEILLLSSLSRSSLLRSHSDITQLVQGLELCNFCCKGTPNREKNFRKSANSSILYRPIGKFAFLWLAVSFGPWPSLDPSSSTVRSNSTLPSCFLVVTDSNRHGKQRPILGRATALKRQRFPRTIARMY